ETWRATSDYCARSKVPVFAQTWHATSLPCRVMVRPHLVRQWDGQM
ncbi:MAG: hypothetical protein HDS16_06860, partial [Bacteroides sp.]|nr:hypothetical protein [Bacteroides sp.]